MASALLRDSTFGQITRKLTGNRILLYPEEQPHFVLPKPEKKLPAAPAPASKDAEKQVDGEPSGASSESGDYDNEAKTRIVDWYSPTDPENPQNWSSGKKIFVFFQICLYTFAGK